MTSRDCEGACLGDNEQASLFVCDPSGNVLKFKAFADPERLFESEG